MKLSYHARIERTDRLVSILAHVGLGEPCLEIASRTEDKTLVLTDTGVLMVYNGSKTVLVTAYLPKCDKMYAICKQYDVEMPWRVLKVLKVNEKKFAWIA